LAKKERIKNGGIVIKMINELAINKPQLPDNMTTLAMIGRNRNDRT
jgi:hypothetical protein